MTPLEIEIERAGDLLRSTPFGSHWAQLFAASQALHWAHDQKSCKSPMDMLKDGPINTQEAREGYPSMSHPVASE